MWGWTKTAIAGLMGAGLIWLLFTGIPQGDGQKGTGRAGGNRPVGDPASVDPRLVVANTRLAFGILSELVERQPEENLFISPMSIALALGMALNGASGETYDRMAHVLGVAELDDPVINQANAALLRALLSADPETEISIANTMWMREGLDLHPDFLAVNKEYLEAEMMSLDFDSPRATETINQWVREATRGRIDRIITRIPRGDILYLINAIYFKGKWQHPFRRAATRDLPFYLLDGSQMMHPMMYASRLFLYLRDDGFQAVSLPYGNGRISMHVFLPDESSTLAAFLGRLNWEAWGGWMHGFGRSRGSLRLPKFRFSYGVKLNPIAQSMGMGIAFDPARADFSRMLSSDEQIWISEIRHKAWVDVDEEGTEAAAATSVGMTAGLDPEPDFRMTVDRPFFFAIRDNETGAILFMGTVVEPK